jgi:SAM-dependent methyltransferase
MPLTYHPQVFDVSTPEQARAIILTPEAGSTTDGRWNAETPYLADMIEAHLQPTRNSLILDYGCGIGRLAKALIQRRGCQVIGVDISASMRALSSSYVDSDRFLVCAPDGLDALIARGVRMDGAIAVWTLQLCFAVRDDVARIRGAMTPGVGLFVVNNRQSAIPTREAGWVNDGSDIRTILSERFHKRQEGRLAPEYVPAALADFTFWAHFTAA